MVRASLVLAGALFVALALPSAAAAQSPIILGPNAVVAWEVDNVPDVATARVFTYAVIVDALPPKNVTPVQCGPGPTGAAATTFTCSTPASQIPQGSHTIAMTAASGSVISLPSTPFAYVDVIIPIPTNVRIKGS